MRAVAIVAAAGLAGSAAAHRAHMHEKLHARATGAWGEWEPDSTTADPAASTSTWTDWDPSSTSTSTTSDSTWTDWDGTTTESTVTVSPTAAASTWTDWDPSTASTVTVSPTAAASSWSDWTTTPSSTTPVIATSTSTWADWTDPAGCMVAYSTGDWTWFPDSVPTTSTIYSTVTVTPTDAAETWSDWDGTTAASTVTVIPTAANSGWGSSSTASASGTGWGSDDGWSSSAAVATPTGASTLGSYSGSTWAMTYSPYTSEGGCKDAGTVSADIASIASKGFTTVRVYSTDCSTLENVGSAARQNGLKLILGVFISSTGITGAQEQVWNIIAWKQWDLVELIVVGNEAVFNGYCSASELAGFVSQSKGYFASNGYTGPVTTTEPIETWLSSGSSLCGSIDVVAGNLYAFFNPDTTADQAGTFIQSEIGELQGVCPGKSVYVMETGWPHAGNCNGVACPGVSQQATAINSIKQVVGAKVVFFTFEDDMWKQPGQFDVEQYWGCADVFPTVNPGW